MVLNIMESIKSVFETKQKPQRLDYTFMYPQKTKRKFTDQDFEKSYQAK